MSIPIVYPSSTHILRVQVLDDCPNKEAVLTYYSDFHSHYRGDCGIDLIFPEHVIFRPNTVKKCNMGIACEFIPSECQEAGPFMLVSRSSITKTPLILANSIGVIDAGYRGPIIGAFRCFDDEEIYRCDKTIIKNPHFVVNAGEKLLQIIAPDMKPISVQVVNTLSNTERGDKGFGSTN